MQQRQRQYLLAAVQPQQQQPQQQLAEPLQRTGQLAVWDQQPPLQQPRLRVAQLLLHLRRQLQRVVQLPQQQQLQVVQLPPQLPPQLPHLPAVQLPPASLRQPLQHPKHFTKRSLFFLSLS